jgi:hypothetical protein
MTQNICSDDGCTAPVKGHGLCRTAYDRQWWRARKLGLTVAGMTDAEFAAVPAPPRKVGKHPFHRSYYEMVYRCTRPDHPRYADYGGRGITVCPTWQLQAHGVGLANYIADLGPKPAGGQRWTVDRVDNNGPYCGGRCGGTCGYGTEGNVRWATYAQQVVNRRKRKDSR